MEIIAYKVVFSCDKKQRVEAQVMVIWTGPPCPHTSAGSTGLGATLVIYPPRSKLRGGQMSLTLHSQTKTKIKEKQNSYRECSYSKLESQEMHCC